MFINRRNRRRVRDLVEISGFLEVAIEQLEKLEQETLLEIERKRNTKEQPTTSAKIKQEPLKAEKRNVLASLDMSLPSNSNASTANFLDRRPNLGFPGYARNTIETPLSTMNGPTICMQGQQIKKEPEQTEDQNSPGHFSFDTAGVALDGLIQRTSTGQLSSEIVSPSGIDKKCELHNSPGTSSDSGINMNCEFSSPSKRHGLSSGMEGPSEINMNCEFSNPSKTSGLSSDIVNHSEIDNKIEFSNPLKTKSRLSSDMAVPTEINMNCEFSNPSKTNKSSSDIGDFNGSSVLHSGINKNEQRKNASGHLSSYECIGTNNDKTIFTAIIRFKAPFSSEEIIHVLNMNGITGIQDIFIKNSTKTYVTFSSEDQYTALMNMRTKKNLGKLFAHKIKPASSAKEKK